ncbi:MAG: hypothetical protein LBS68_02435, partial [Puniceicoccales bacterium]|nr:hypothetical protein [Puniceicoccales bacterium]
MLVRYLFNANDVVDIAGFQGKSNRPLAKILSHSKPHGRRNQRPLKMGLPCATLSEEAVGSHQ